MNNWVPLREKSENSLGISGEKNGSNFEHNIGSGLIQG